MVGNPLFDTLLLGVFIAGAVSAVLLLFVTAPYGRHAKKGWGPELPTRLAWVLMESPASLVFAFFFFSGPHWRGVAPLVLFAMWQLHYAHRAFVYPFQLRIREGSGTTAITAALGSTYCAVNGYLNGSYISTYGSHLHDPAWSTDPRFLLGVAVFAYGYFLNKQSDRILRDLRKPGETGYKIPHGGGYRWVSSPNYLGELITWVGFAIAAQSLAAWSFVFFTAANLVPRALANHRWYRERFPDEYPPERKAIIPGLL